jgi:signal transduction histidine kinase
MALASRFPMAVCWGTDLSVVYNDAFVPLLGSKHPEVFGKTGLEVWGDVWDSVSPLFQKALGGEATWSEDQCLPLQRRGFAEETYFTGSFSPIVDETGTVRGALTAVQETTTRVLSARRQATLRELAELVAEAKTADQAAVVSIATLAKNRNDVPFAAVYFRDGDRYRRAAGWGVDEAVAPQLVYGHFPWRVGSVTKSGTPFRVHRSDVRLPGGPWPEPAESAFVVPLAKPGQEEAFGALVVGISPRLDFDEAYGSFLKLVGHQISRAISHAIAREEERRREAALTDIDRAKTAFFSNVSQEFRTPLTLMLGPLQEIVTEPEADPAKRERSRLLHRNALLLLKLVNNLLDFSRIEAGRNHATYEPTDLSSLTSEIASSFQSACDRAGLTLTVDCPPMMEPVFVDRDMWEKIVLNLLSNAFKYTFEGGISVAIALAGQSVQLTVRDTGIGIAEQDVPHIFERFRRIEGSKARSHEGSGIGLALVHELVRLHGGAIDVESRLGEGSAFRVSVPLGFTHLPQDQLRSRPRGASRSTAISGYVEEALSWVRKSASSPPPPMTAADDAGRRERILLADDNADMRSYLSRLLRERWEVETADDGHAALEAIRLNPPDLVLSDVMMRGIDGFALLRAVRNDAALRDIPFILLSAQAGEEATAEGLKAGADDYLVKPFTSRDLFVRITARLAARTAAREMREQRTSLYHALMQSPFIVNIFRGPDHVIELANEVSLKRMGKGPEIIGKPLRDALPEGEGQAIGEILDRVYRTGAAYEGRAEVGQAPGPAAEQAAAYYSHFYAPLFDSRGEVEGVMLCSFEVTEQVRARQRAETLTAELEATSRAKDEFLATMSHELRTPLHAVLGWTALLKRDSTKLQHGLEVIERNAQAQVRLVSDLLDVSRIISGKLRLNLKKADIAGAIGAAADVVRPAATAKGVRLVLDMDPALGHLVADPDRLQQIMWNLLSNAVRFTPAGGRVTVTAQRSSSSIHIVVQDTGIGIAADQIAHVFERFRQLDSSTTRSHGGLGLGLAIVRHLIEAHGGEVSATSEGPGKGTSFSLWLPVHAVHVVEETAEAEAEEETKVPSSSRGLLSGARVLIVDDDADSLELLRIVLEGAGASVVGATGARQALDAGGPFDAVISDIGMPEMDGYTLIRNLRSRSHGADVPAIALTAFARSEDSDRALRAGYQVHLAKPVESTRLVQEVAGLIRQRRGDAP